MRVSHSLSHSPNPMRYIIRRGASYHLHWGVPKDIRHLFGGRSAITRPLSSDLATALTRRDLAIGELSKVLRAARSAEEGHEFDSFLAGIRQKLPQLPEQPATTPAPTPAAPPAPTPAPEPALPITARKGLLLKEAVRLYLKETDLAGSMVSRLKMAPTLLLKHLALKDIHLSEIDRRDVQLWAEACSKEKAAGTVRTYISALAGLWEWAYRNKRVEGENPFKDLNLRLPTATAKRGAFTPAHVSALLAHASPGMRVLMEFALITGCRLGELTTITPQDFKQELIQDRAISYFQINEGKTENAARIVPLPLPMWERLREVVASGLWVREKTRTRDASAYWSAMFQKLKGSVLNDAEGLVFHSFRKMAATGYQRAGVFEGITAELLGHSRKGLTMSYGLYATGYSLEQLLAAVETMLASGYMQQYLVLFGK